MDNNSSSNEDEEPKVCTVFASPSSSGSKTVFDTIAFSKKELTPSPSTSSLTTTNINTNVEETRPTSDNLLPTTPSFENNESMMQSIYLPSSPAATPRSDHVPEPADIFAEATETKDVLSEALEGLTIQEESTRDDGAESQTLQVGQGDEGKIILEDNNIGVEVESPIPTANRLFVDTPEMPFPVGVGEFSGADSSAAFFNQLSSSSSPPQTQTTASASSEPFQSQKQIDSPSNNEPSSVHQSHVTPSVYTSMTEFDPLDVIYDAWIPKEGTRKILLNIEAAMKSGGFFPDKSSMTTPGIIYEDDLIDKVSVNMARIFGEAEASKRRILNADSVTQDDKGLRELIKLGCYRSAINLTKRLLTLYGQGPGKVGQFSKHNPHTLQLWFTRLSLLIRIREFTIAESEIDAFKDFDNPDLYFEYYPDSYGKGRKGSMVPFNFRLLAAEIVQYSKKHNNTIDRLHKILGIINQILRNVKAGKLEDGSEGTIDEERKAKSLEIWGKREIRVHYSLANAFLFAKDHHNAFKYLSILSEKDKEKEPQLKSAIGRFFLQLGDLSTASQYFNSASDLRLGESDAEQVENLVDSAMIQIAHGQYPEALALLRQALLIQPDNFMITNNMAVCLLYMGKVKESLDLMETTVKNNTPQLLQENVLLNLSTIYELENTDGHKKNALLKLCSEYKGDGINLACLKMPNLI